MAALVPYRMTALTVSPPSLEDIFLRQYSTASPDAAAEGRQS